MKPVPGGGLTEAKAWTETPYGKAQAEWKLNGGKITVKITVPVGTECELVLPDGTRQLFSSGTYEKTAALQP